MVMHRKVIVHPGVTIEYSGPESIVERLNSSRPIAIDLILEAGLLVTFDSPPFGDVSPLKRTYDIPGVIRREGEPAADYVRVHSAEEDSEQLHVAAQRLVDVQSNVPGHQVP